MTLQEALPGTLVMAPMTKGSNLPYRRLCVELGARVTLSEMAVARRLKHSTALPPALAVYTSSPVVATSATPTRMSLVIA